MIFDSSFQTHYEMQYCYVQGHGSMTFHIIVHSQHDLGWTKCKKTHTHDLRFYHYVKWKSLNYACSYDTLHKRLLHIPSLLITYRSKQTPRLSLSNRFDILTSGWGTIHKTTYFEGVFKSHFLLIVIHFGCSSWTWYTLWKTWHTHTSRFLWHVMLYPVGTIREDVQKWLKLHGFYRVVLLVPFE